MGIPTIITDLALIMTVASISTIIFKWLKQPIILGYIVAGFLVSKQFIAAPDIIGEADVEVWAKIGVIFLLFALGLEFSFRKVAKVGKSALSASMIIIPGMILVGLGVGKLMGWTTSNSLMLGCMICMSSTTIILKALDDLDLRNHRFTGVVLGVLIFEDLAAIMIMVLLPTIAAGQEFEGLEFAYAILRMAFFLIIWLVFGIFFIPSILKRVKGFLNDETLLIVATGLCLGMVYIASAVGFSEEFGAFVMGSILAETIEAEKITKVMTPIKDFFGAVFFVSVGMMIDPSILVEYWKEILMISGAIIIGQVCLGTTGVLFSGATLRSAIQSGFSLTQVGEFAFIVALLGTQLNLCDAFLYPIIVAVSVVTIFITPFMMKSAIPVVEWLNVKMPEKWKAVIERTQTKKEIEGGDKNVWKNLLTQIFEIVAIYGSVCTAIIVVFVYYIIPLATELSGSIWPAVLLTIVSLFLISPFVRAIIAKKNHSTEYKYLLAANRSNWTPLVGLALLRAAVGVFVVFKLINGGVLQEHPIYSTFISIGIILLIFRSRTIKYLSIKIERKFFYNLNIREIEMRKNITEKASVFESANLSKSLSAHDLHLADFVVDANAECCDKTLIELNLRNVCGVHVVSIIRGEIRINIPGGKEKIMPCDKVLALGTDDQLTAVAKVFGKPTFNTNIQKKEVSVEQIIIEEGSALEGKSILESGIRDNAKCLVVGIEHEGESTMSPSIHTKFCVGDVVWIAGEKDKIQNLIQSTLTSIDIK
ncbi:MAG: cation:proton antiporter [Paludibacteraceae bacterium]|nr:cation:proton antiporter [Paludibacteraceae bacterium]